MLRQYLIFLLLLISTQTFSQDNKSSLDWKDTAFTSVTLSDTKGGKKIVTLEVGNKATIYLKLNLLRQSATEMKNDFNGKELTKIIYILDSSSKVSDTVLIENHLLYLDYLVSLQLQGGNGLVYYKKINSFVPTISHRLEKYGMYAYRFFYLPDRRPFYSTMEVSGIIENHKYSSDPNELVRLGEKLAELRKE